MRIRTVVFPSALLLLSAAALAACGQKGPLHKTDEGIQAVPEAPVSASDAAGAPVTPSSPDRSGEERKRIPENPAPAPAQ